MSVELTVQDARATTRANTFCTCVSLFMLACDILYTKYTVAVAKSAAYDSSSHCQCQQWLYRMQCMNVVMTEARDIDDMLVKTQC